MNGEDKITILKWIDKLFETHEKSHQIERMADKKALEIQAKEYERRLDDLNHAHQQAQENFERFVSQEKFFGLERDVRNMEKTLSKISGIGITLAFGLTVVNIVVGILLHFWK